MNPLSVNSTIIHNFWNLTISVVDHCGYNCKNCMHFTTYRPEKEYSEKDFIPSIKIMIDKGIINNQEILLAGGEPFLHSDIIGFVENLSSNILLPIVMCSNGFWLSNTAICRYARVFKKLKRLTITQYKPFSTDALLAISKLKTIMNVIILPRTEFAVPSFSSVPIEPVIPRVALNANHCRFVDCIQLLSDKRLMKCPAGYAGMSSFPVSEEFRSSNHMFYHLDRPSEPFLTWWNRYPFDACYYCRLGSAPHSFA